MKNVLTFTQNGKKYISKPFDFEAMCITNEAHNVDTKKGLFNICRDAVDYLFEGVVSQEVMDSLDVTVKAYLCIDLWGLYVEALEAMEAVKSND